MIGFNLSFIYPNQSVEECPNIKPLTTFKVDNLQRVQQLRFESRINYIAFIVLGIIFILVGQALNELDVTEAINANSVSKDDNLTKWYEFLLPWVGDEATGLPTPWGP